VTSCRTLNTTPRSLCDGDSQEVAAQTGIDGLLCCNFPLLIHLPKLLILPWLHLTAAVSAQGHSVPCLSLHVHLFDNMLF
jgi:hypothetical protein